MEWPHLWTLQTCGPVDYVDSVDSVDPVDLWNHVDLWTCGPVDLWTLWTCGPVDLWTCGPVDSVNLWTLWTCRLDYQPLFGKMSPHSSPERAAGRVRFPLLV